MTHSIKTQGHGEQSRTMIKSIQQRRGYAILELLFYIAFFSIFSLIVIDAMLTMAKSFRETALQAELVQSGVIMERISREIRASYDISSMSAGNLKLNTIDNLGANKTVEFLLSGGNVKLLENGVLIGNLNTPNITVTDLTFTQITTVKGKAVKVSLTFFRSLPQFSPYQEAESAVLASTMTIGSDPLASGGNFIYSTSGQHFDEIQTGLATFTFNVPTSGTYVVWGRIFADNYINDSFYVSVDDGAEDIYDIAEGTWSSLWQWTKVNGRNNSVPLTLNPRTFPLTAGSHTIKFRAREVNAKLDKIFITNDLSAVPSDAGFNNNANSPFYFYDTIVLRGGY